MAQKLSQRTELAATPAADDYIHIVDRSDTTDGPDGTSKRISISNLIAFVGGPLIPQGNWNASTNTPDITGTTTAGFFWIVSVAGSTDLGGITDWAVNDWAVRTATGWAKVDNTQDLSTHSVTELNDVTSAGSGAIITTAERNKLNLLSTDQIFSYVFSNTLSGDPGDGNIAGNDAARDNWTELRADLFGSNPLGRYDEIWDQFQGYITITSVADRTNHITFVTTGDIQQTGGGTGYFVIPVERERDQGTEFTNGEDLLVDLLPFSIGQQRQLINFGDNNANYREVDTEVAEKLSGAFQWNADEEEIESVTANYYAATVGTGTLTLRLVDADNPSTIYFAATAANSTDEDNVVTLSVVTAFPSGGTLNLAFYGFVNDDGGMNEGRLESATIVHRHR